MLGLALEGGGSKGAYEIGAYKALEELGFHFDAVVGSSIGAINAALIASGDVDRAVEFWSTMTTEDLFDDKDKGFLDVINLQFDLDTLSILRENIKTAKKNGGIDTGRIRRFLEENINVEHLMESPMDFGMAAVSFPEMKPLYAFREDMTPENVIDHILASATFAGFQMTEIGDKKYVDGGFHDSCPYNMLFDRGFDEVVAIRLFGFGIIRPPHKKEGLINILPSEPLGSVMNFDPEVSKRNLKLGYYDTMRTMKKLPGEHYYFDRRLDGFETFLSLTPEYITAAASALRISPSYPPRRALFEEILPSVASECKLPKSADYDDLLLAMIEHRAERLGIDRLQIVTPQDLLKQVREMPLELSRRPILLPRSDDAIDTLLYGITLPNDPGKSLME